MSLKLWYLTSCHLWGKRPSCINIFKKPKAFRTCFYFLTEATGNENLSTNIARPKVFTVNVQNSQLDKKTHWCWSSKISNQFIFYQYLEKSLHKFHERFLEDQYSNKILRSFVHTFMHENERVLKTSKEGFEFRVHFRLHRDIESKIFFIVFFAAVVWNHLFLMRNTLFLKWVRNLCGKKTTNHSVSDYASWWHFTRRKQP